jgi:uncharacterized protein YabN with tetrapyrrole methylase and pyrophosphatase domain
VNNQFDIGEIEKLLEIMARLRTPECGCPWDLEQTFASIAPYTIEEAYEVVEAIERGRFGELADELGDLLFQVVFHAQMGREAGAFTFADVTRHICAKMIRRHPHVFGGARMESAAAQTVAWEALKRDEKRRARLDEGSSDAGSLDVRNLDARTPVEGSADEGSADEGGVDERDLDERVLDGVTRALPALSRAVKLGRRAARVGFDWPDSAGPRTKIDEELAELDEAAASGERARVVHEVGDLLFAVANLCRHLDVDPEQCARAANRRFETRFAHVERRVGGSGRGWAEHSLEDLDAYWAEAKEREEESPAPR